MYLHLPYTAHSVFQCPKTGYVGVVKCYGLSAESTDDYSDDYDYDYDDGTDAVGTYLEIYNPELALASGIHIQSSHPDIADIVAIEVERDHDLTYINTIVVAVHLRDCPTRDAYSSDDGDTFVCKHLITDTNSYEPSSYPFEILHVHSQRPLEHSVLYKVPARLIDFIKLPQVCAYSRKMVMSVWIFAGYGIPCDVACVIVVFAVQSYRELDYAQYCEAS